MEWGWGRGQGELPTEHQGLPFVCLLLRPPIPALQEHPGIPKQPSYSQVLICRDRFWACPESSGSQTHEPEALLMDWVAHTPVCTRSTWSPQAATPPRALFSRWVRFLLPLFPSVPSGLRHHRYLRCSQVFLRGKLRSFGLISSRCEERRPFSSVSPPPPPQGKQSLLGASSPTSLLAGPHPSPSALHV